MVVAVFTKTCLREEEDEEHDRYLWKFRIKSKSAHAAAEEEGTDDFANWGP